MTTTKNVEITTINNFEEKQQFQSSIEGIEGELPNHLQVVNGRIVDNSAPKDGIGC